MTKIMFSLITLAFAAGTLSAQENLLKNGGFEQIVKKTKSGDRYIQEKIKAGWNFGAGPLAKVPAEWIPNLGSAKLEIADAEKEKENVHGGRYAMRLTTGENKGAHIYTSGAKAGKYEIAVWAKGKGKFSVTGYFYRKDPESGKTRYVASVPLVQGTAKENSWTEFKKRIDTAKIKPEAGSFKLALSAGKNSCIVFDDVKLSPEPVQE